MIKQVRKRSRRQKEPMDLQLSLRMNFGDKPDDAITVMDNANIPLVGSVFDSRDRIMRAFAMTMLKVGLAQPRVARELFPFLKILRRHR
jgi:hypothetical protein